MYILLGVIIFAISITTRAWVRFWRRDFGIDTWYYLNYAEAFRKEKRLPVKLKHYLLDIEEQWYPPFFPFIVSLFSKKLTDKYHWVIAAIIDSLQAVMLYVFSLLLTHRIDVAIFATLLYVASTVNASMATNLNTRPLASLVSTLLMLVLYSFSLKPGIPTLIIVLILGIILLHTHKMATQQFLFFAAGLAILNKDPRYLYILFLIFISSLIATKGHYLKILKNNIQIVQFWAKNLPYLLKHQVYASFLYKDTNKAKTKIGFSGLKMHKVMFFLARAQLLACLAIIIAFWLTKKNASNITNLSFLFYWVFINYFTVIITTYLPLFKFIGEGFKYLIYGTFAVSFLAAYGIINIFPNIAYSYLILTVLISISFYIQIFTLSRQELNVNAFVDNELKKIINILKGTGEDNIMCIPVSKAEPVAYLANKRVLWGGHGSGWNLLDEFWPIVKTPLEKLIDKYRISLLLLDKRFVDISDLKIQRPAEIIFEGENYILARFKNGSWGQITINIHEKRT